MTPAAVVAASFTEVAPFHVHLDVLGVVAAFVIAYEYGIRRLAADHAPRSEPAVTPRQRVFFYAGIATIFVVATWPVHDLGESSLFTFHMIEHLGVSLVAPPLLLLGTPWWLLRLAVRPILPVLKLITRPIPALIAFNVTLAVFHVPGVVEAMLTSDAVHFVLHGLLFSTAVLMWWPVIGPIPDTATLSPFGKMGYLFLQSLVPTIPASFLTLGTTPLYGIYETFPRLWGISAITDQTIAGLIMKLGGGAILWFGIAFVFFRWAAEEQRASLQNRRAGVVSP